MKRIVLLMMLVSSPAAALEDCRTLGWHFYCDPSVEEEVPVPPEPQTTPELPSIEPPDARARIKTIREHLDELKAEAILDPSSANLIAYIGFQREQLDRASTFSDQWRRVIWQNPEMDYDLIRPTGSIAKQAWSDLRQQVTATTLADLNNRYGIFYFFNGKDCPQCEAFETALKPFIEKHALNVMAITLDGVASPNFMSSVSDSGQAARLGITGEHLPALALFDSENNQVIPVSFGALAADELERRMFILTQVEVGNDY